MLKNEFKVKFTGVDDRKQNTDMSFNATKDFDDKQFFDSVEKLIKWWPAGKPRNVIVVADNDFDDPEKFVWTTGCEGKSSYKIAEELWKQILNYEGGQ